jgi:hypothetical protein
MGVAPKRRLLALWGTAAVVALLCGLVFVAGIWRDVPRGRSPMPASWRTALASMLDIGLASYAMALPGVVFMAVALMSARDLSRAGSAAALWATLLAAVVLAILLVV